MKRECSPENAILHHSVDANFCFFFPSVRGFREDFVGNSDSVPVLEEVLRIVAADEPFRDLSGGTEACHCTLWVFVKFNYGLFYDDKSVLMNGCC